VLDIGLATTGRASEENKSRGVTMFSGAGWEYVLYVLWRGGARGTNVCVFRRGGGDEGQAGGVAVGW
jgi:hypothetical protein